MAKIILVTGLMVGYAYLMEFFIAYYSGSAFERFHFMNREFGNMWWAGWIMFVVQRDRAARVLVQVVPAESVGADGHLRCW